MATDADPEALADRVEQLEDQLTTLQSELRDQRGGQWAADLCLPRLSSAHRGGVGVCLSRGDADGDLCRVVYELQRRTRPGRRQHRLALR